MKKIIRIFTSRALILSIQVLLSAIFLFIVYETNIIPQKYFMMIAAALVVLLGIFWLIIQTGKKKAKEKGKTSKRVIITKIISLLLSIILGVGCLYVNRGVRFLENVQVTIQKYAVNVIVLKDGKYAEATLEDLNGCQFGISYEKENATLNKALAELEEEIDTQKYEKIDTYTELADRLYDGSVDAIVVGNEYKSMLEVNHEGFDEETRIVKTY